METAIPAPFTGRVRCLLAGRTSRSTSAPPCCNWTRPIRIRTPGIRRPAWWCLQPGDATTTTPERGETPNSVLLRGLVLGYDVEAVTAWASIAELAPAWRAVGSDPDLVAAEHAALIAFADLRALFGVVRDEARTICRSAPPKSTSTPTSGR